MALGLKNFKLPGSMMMVMQNFYIVFMTLALWMTDKKARLRIPRKLPVSRSTLKTAFIMLLGFYPLMAAMNQLSLFLPGVAPAATKESITMGMIPVITLMAPVCEELAFRHFLTKNLERFFSDKKAIIIQEDTA